MEQAANITAPVQTGNLASIETRYLNFDPMEYIDTRLCEPALKAKLASRAVWMLDNRIIDTAVGLYFDVRADNVDVSARDIEGIIAAFRGTYSNEKFWGMGNAIKLTMLLSMQEAWHEAATRMNFANGNINYVARSVDELLINAKPRQLTPQARTNLDAAAGFVAEDGNMSKEEALKNLLEADKIKAESNVEFRRSLLPAINTFIVEARKYMRAGLNFGELDTTTRLMLNRGVFGGIAPAMTDLAKVLDTTTYMMVLREAAAARRVMNEVVTLLARDLERERAEASV